MTTTSYCRSAGETLTLIQPLLKRIGVTRLADLTGLDQIGIPVFASVRPDSRSLVVDSGKGTTKEQAKCSAAMESIERWALDEVPIVCSSPQCGSSEWERCFPINVGACIPNIHTQKWTTATELATGHEIQVPYYFVKMYTGKETLVEKPWYVTTNGMSAGNTRDEAILSGLYEVIERDGVHLAITNSLFNGVPMRRLDLDSIDVPILNDLIEKIQKAGGDPLVYDARNEIGAPTFICLLTDREKGVGFWRGYGTHHDPVIALTRAICEAVQTRCVILSGTRDDVTWAVHRKMILDSTSDIVKGMKEDPCVCNFEDISPMEEGAIFEVMREKGFRILVVDFPIPGNIVCAVKVLVPQFASYYKPYSEVGRPKL